jgi:hypothetical protein
MILLHQSKINLNPQRDLFLYYIYSKLNPFACILVSIFVPINSFCFYMLKPKYSNH